uniref:Ig-like domain-containing protein n=1 Tax=Haplochromis burtoni TaxID=8153 RepID=A0A3Q2VKK3_HAPBU
EGEVSWGQNISITCSVSSEFLDGTFTLKKTSSNFSQTETGSRSATFNIHRVDFSDKGLYQCQYEKRISSNTFSSPLSDSVRISVTGKKKYTFLNIIPAGEVTWGQNIGITCSISTQTLGGTFILMKTSDSFKKTQNSNTNSATFNIPEVDFDDEGLYQCQYQESGPSQQFYSPTSDSVRLSVTGKKTNDIFMTVLKSPGVTALSSPVPLTPHFPVDILFSASLAPTSQSQQSTTRPPLVSL